MEQAPISNLQPPSVAATMTSVPEGIIRALIDYGAITDYGVSAGEVLVSIEQLRRVGGTPSTADYQEPLRADRFTGALFALASLPVLDGVEVTPRG